jgi:death on curing protein
MSSAEDVVYLELRDVLEIHADIFGISDEQAADHLRNTEGLHSVLARPKQYAYYQGADLALQGAVISHGIAEGQLFVDGNKRTAAMCLVSFLADNALTLNCTHAELADWILKLSEGETEEELAERVRSVLIPFEP